MPHLRILACLALASSSLLYAGGPRLVAGSTYFDPVVMGQPIHWPDGQVNYYVDQGPLSVAAGASATWTTQALVLQGGVPQPGQVVAWQNGSGFSGSASGPVTTGANGIAAKTFSAGPLTAGQKATVNACLNGTSQCVTFTATGSDPATATLSAVSGTSQSLALGQTPEQIVLRVRDASGNPLSGATVTVSQALYAWAPPCAPHGRCAQSELLSMQSASAVSAVDGSVAFSPAGIAGAATNTLAVATTGTSATVNIGIEQHP